MKQIIFDLQPVLENELLILRPLEEKDFENLYKVASDPLIWDQHPAKDRYRKEVFTVLFKDAMLSGGAFAIIDRKTGGLIGSTRFHFINETQNAIEIGWTFLSRQYWGGVYIKSMKSLMIEYAFNTVDNVLFYVNKNNFRSQKAVGKIGGEPVTSLEGQLLEIRPDASVIYNITKEKWKSIAE